MAMHIVDHIPSISGGQIPIWLMPRQLMVRYSKVKKAPQKRVCNLEIMSAKISTPFLLHKGALIH